LELTIKALTTKNEELKKQVISLTSGIAHQKSATLPSGSNTSLKKAATDQVWVRLCLSVCLCMFLPKLKQDAAIVQIYYCLN